MKRTLLAIGVAIVILASSATTIGFLAQSETEAEPFQVAPIRIGDAFHYEGSHNITGEFVGTGVVATEYGYQEVVWLHLTHNESTKRYAMADGQFFGSGSYSSRAAASSSFSIEGVIEDQKTVYKHEWQFRLNGSLPPCGFVHSWQEAAVKEGAGLGCGSMQVLGKDGQYLVVGNAQHRLWLQADLSLPVRIASGNQTFDLAAWSDGNQTPTLQFESASLRLPVTTKPTGNDQYDVDAALDAAGPHGLDDYLAANHATLIGATVSQYEEENTGTKSAGVVWDFSFGGDDPRMFRYYNLMQTIQGVDIAPEERFHDLGSIEAPSIRPATWPAAKDSPWPDGEWMFRTECGGACGVMGVGHSERTRLQEQGALTGVGSTMYNTTFHLFDHEGLPVGFEMQQANYQQSTTTPITPVSNEEVQETFSAGPAGWQPPTAKQWTFIAIFGVVAGALVRLWPIIKALPFIGLLSKEEVVNHPVRQHILQIVNAEPGVHHKELMRSLGKGNQVTRHHVDALRRAGLLLEKPGMGMVHYYPHNMDRNLMARQQVRHPAALAILAAAKEPVTGRDLAAAAKISPSTVSYHVRRLQDLGLLHAQRQGRNVYYHAG